MPNAPNTENYFLGAGILYFAQFLATGVKRGELDLGNCTDFKLNLTTEKLEHYNQRAGIAVKDKEVVKQLNANGSFTLDEYTKENLMLALYGDMAKLAQSSGSVSAEAISDIEQGRYYPLLHRNVSNVVVDDGATPFTVNVDYRVDAATGRIYIIPDGAIADDDTIYVDYDYSAVDYDMIRAFKQSKITGYLRFIGDPASGSAYECEVWKCSLSPNGDLSFLGNDAWGKLDFSLTIEKDETHTDDPFFHVIERAANFGITESTTTA